MRSGTHKPELFVERENLANTSHLSLHASGQWHHSYQGRPSHRWNRPDEITPGYTRALAMVQPVVVATVSDPAPDAARLFPLDADADPMNFNFYIERPGANPEGWPGRNSQNTTLVGRLPLAGGVGSACVTAHGAPFEPGSPKTTRPTDDQRQWLEESVARDDLYMTLLATQRDGTVALIDFRLEAKQRE